MLDHGEKNSGEANPLRRRCDYLAQVWMNHQRAGSGPEVFDARYVGSWSVGGYEKDRCRRVAKGTSSIVQEMRRKVIAILDHPIAKHVADGQIKSGLRGCARGYPFAMDLDELDPIQVKRGDK